MGCEPMELAKNWDAKKADIVLPAYAEIKYDGVPLTFCRDAAGVVQALTRQNEVCKSVEHMLPFADMLLLKPRGSFTAEIILPGKPFKDTSGLVRQQHSDEESTRLLGVVFDSNLFGQKDQTYHTRKTQFENMFATVATQFKVFGRRVPFFPIKAISVYTVDQVMPTFGMLQAMSKAPIEGMVMHTMNKPYRPGKRCWGMSRYKPQPTIDLEIRNFEEAISEAGDGLGMVGRVNVWLRRRTPSGPVSVSSVGVGPGKLSHDFRRELWERYGKSDVTGLYAEIKHMPDPTYDALRQPTIQRLRTDKTEGDILEY
jgi:ATP-dependent DNA ligase